MMTARHLLVTFDDGPDERLTPQLLDCLAKHDIPAVFFVQGEHAATDAGLRLGR